MQTVYEDIAQRGYAAVAAEALTRVSDALTHSKIEIMRLKDINADLLAALETALTWADQGCGDACMNAVQQARTAIARAKGQQ